MILLLALDACKDTHVYLTFAGTTFSYNTAVSEKGMKVTLPEKTYLQELTMLVQELLLFSLKQDKDEDVGDGMEHLQQL